MKPRDVAARARQAGDEPHPHRVAHDRKHDGDGTGLSVQCCRHRCGPGKDNVGLQRDQLRRERTRTLHIGICPPLLNLRMATVYPTQSCQFLHESGEKGLMFRIALGQPHQHADAAHLPCLLRGCGAEPKCGCPSDCARERGNKFATLHRRIPRPVP
jgi:hypothetical protein